MFILTKQLISFLLECIVHIKLSFVKFMLPEVVLYCFQPIPALTAPGIFFIETKVINRHKHVIVMYVVHLN